LVVQRRLAPSGCGESGPAGFPFGFADRCGLVGESSLAWALRERIAFVGPRRGHVLIVGASGVGKELVARAVHAASDRAERALCARNAATIPEGIVDAELFGNARNYPNPGVGERAGLIGDADGTSLFLDEFGELPLSAQAHFLRVLDSGEYQRLGESRMRVSSFRLIAATNRPLSVLKDDVLARLMFRIEVSDLNARKEDVPLLARHLLCRILSTDDGLAHRFWTAERGTAVPSLSLRFVRGLLSRDYVSHARELEGILWRALETSGVDVIEPVADERMAIASGAAPRQGADWTLAPPPAGAEDDLGAAIQRCLDANNGALEPTFRELGLSSRHALARLIRKHGLEVRKRTTR
jgi:transcriptional regulator with GAF, ATPase, and Fis domain